MTGLSKPEAIGAVSVALVAASGVFLWVRSKRKNRPSQEDLEAQRRAWLAAYGKLSGGEIVELQAQSITYCYDVRGINYTASQDISALNAHLPEDRWSIIGGVGVRYHPRNPANSIVLCETWTGLRRRE